MELKTLRTMPNSRSRRRLLGFTVAALTGVWLVLWGVGLADSTQFIFGLPPANAQLSNPNDVSQQVYQRLPDFPRENQYVNKETGKVAVDNTLVSRLIRYHLYVKSRTPRYRLDWKLTLADYLGANEYLVETRYPGYDTLKQSPFDGDRAAIRHLNRTQREALVDVLVSIFNPNPQEPKTAPPRPTPTPRASIQPSIAEPLKPSPITLPRSGASELLKP